MKKGQLQSSIMMWLGLLLVAIICILWLIPNLEPYHIDLEKMSIDLEKIQGKVNAACNSMIYKSYYNPLSSKGELSILNTEFCINNSVDLCRTTLCETGLNITFDLSNITYIIIEKNEEFKIYEE